MKKRMSSIIPQAIGACALITAASTQAFMDEGSFYVVPSAGYHMTQKLKHYKDAAKHDTAVKEYKFDDSMDFGIAGGYQLDGNIAIEVAYNYTQFDIVEKYEAGGETKKKTRFNYLHVDGVYYFSNIYENDFSFYIPVGLGWVDNSPKKDKGKAFKSVNYAAINIGVGAQYMFTENFGVRGDVRGLYGFKEQNVDAIVEVGAVFRFGMPARVNNSMAANDGIKSADIRFKLNSTQVVNASDPDIAALAEAVKNNPNANIKIMAYSDKSGPSAYNLKLSQRRADSLKHILMTKYGVSESRIYTKAFGDQKGMSKDRHAVAVVEY